MKAPECYPAVCRPRFTSYPGPAPNPEPNSSTVTSNATVGPSVTVRFPRLPAQHMLPPEYDPWNPGSDPENDLDSSQTTYPLVLSIPALSHPSSSEVEEDHENESAADINQLTDVALGSSRESGLSQTATRAVRLGIHPAFRARLERSRRSNQSSSAYSFSASNSSSSSSSSQPRRGNESSVARNPGHAAREIDSMEDLFSPSSLFSRTLGQSGYFSERLFEEDSMVMDEDIFAHWLQSDLSLPRRVRYRRSSPLHQETSSSSGVPSTSIGNTMGESIWQEELAELTVSSENARFRTPTPTPFRPLSSHSRFRATEKDRNLDSGIISATPPPTFTDYIFCECSCAKIPSGELWSPENCPCYKRQLLDLQQRATILKDLPFR